MDTRITASVATAARFLRAGQVVAFPTETVYGLGADALNDRAVGAIFRAKGRPADNPLIVHVSDLSMVARVARRIPAAAERLMSAFFPGPLTVIVPRHRDVPLSVTAGLDTVGLRWPALELAQSFIAACDTPVAAPSANRSGRPSPTTWQAVREEMQGRIACILKGAPTSVGLESTVVDCTGSRPRVLRLGGLSLEALREVVPAISVPRAQGGPTGPVLSPGMKYRHYAPTPSVVLVAGPEEIPRRVGERFGYIGLDGKGLVTKPVRLRLVPDAAVYAQQLFRFFRVCEKARVQTIYCQMTDERGLGRALMDRLRRAATVHPTGS